MLWFACCLPWTVWRSTRDLKVSTRFEDNTRFEGQHEIWRATRDLKVNSRSEGQHEIWRSTRDLKGDLRQMLARALVAGRAKTKNATHLTVLNTSGRAIRHLQNKTRFLNSKENQWGILQYNSWCQALILISPAFKCNVALRPQRPWGLLGTRSSPGFALI